MECVEVSIWRCCSGSTGEHIMPEDILTSPLLAWSNCSKWNCVLRRVKSYSFMVIWMKMVSTWVNLMASGAWCRRTSSPMRPTSTTTKWDRALGAAPSVSGAGARDLVLGDHHRRRGTTWCLASLGNVVHQAKVSRLCEDSLTVKLILHFIMFCVSITFRFHFNTIFTKICDTKNLFEKQLQAYYLFFVFDFDFHWTKNNYFEKSKISKQISTEKKEKHYTLYKIIKYAGSPDYYYTNKQDDNVLHSSSDYFYLYKILSISLVLHSYMCNFNLESAKMKHLWTIRSLFKMKPKTKTNSVTLKIFHSLLFILSNSFAKFQKYLKTKTQLQIVMKILTVFVFMNAANFRYSKYIFLFCFSFYWIIVPYDSAELL